MKKLVYGILIAVAILSGCKYESYHEAKIGCGKWARAGGTYTVQFVETEYSWVPPFARSEVPKEEKEEIRYCKEEKMTNQILGFEKKSIAKGAVVVRDYNKNYGEEVAKKFKYK